MANKHKKFSSEEKARLLRLHLIEKEPVSDICDHHGLNRVLSMAEKVYDPSKTYKN